MSYLPPLLPHFQENELSRNSPSTATLRSFFPITAAAPHRVAFPFVSPGTRSNRLCRCGGDIGEGLALARPVQFLAGLFAASQMEVVQH